MRFRTPVSRIVACAQGTLMVPTGTTSFRE
jgi:hypothetical protein